MAGFAPNFSENEWPCYHGDIDCTNSSLIYSPSDAVYWVVHIRDFFDYNAVEENHTQKKQFLKVYQHCCTNGHKIKRIDVSTVL